jgi:hypothetical protein
MKLYIKQLLREGINSRLEISLNSLPNTLYHVTTNYQAVLSSGVLKAQSGLDKGGLGGTESVGVSLVTDKNIAINIYNELKLINFANSVTDNSGVEEFLNMIDDLDRRDIVKNEFDRTISLYKDYSVALIGALQLTRVMLKFSGKPFHNLVIFNESNIKSKDIGIIEVNKNNINPETKIIQGVDKHLGEIRVLGDIKI